MKPVCGFVGLGGQGAPIARRMVDAGLDVVLWARRPESLEPFRDTPARYAATLAELGAQADHVGVCVVDDADVRQVCNALIPAMRGGGLIAIHATVHPETCRAVAAQAAGRGIRVVDAPVSGGGPAAQAGELTVMLGGDPADVAQARAVFEAFGRLIIHLGAVGTGQEAKLINNTLFAANLGMAHEALKAAEELGVSQEALVELLMASSGQSYGVRVRARMPAPPAFLHAGNLLAKDVRLLGEVLGAEDPAYGPLRASANQFLSFVLGPAQETWETQAGAIANERETR